MPKRILQGVVVGDKNDQTIVVKVERRVMHPMYRKIIRKSKNVHAHDPENRYKVGDIVRVQECSPISKLKRFQVVQDAN